jgi:hypothetical protein
MDQSAASGERNALRGYRWQYDQLSAIVYDALLDDELQSLRLTDPEAGKVDDLVLVTATRRSGYQFKSAQPPGMITYTDLVKPRRTRSGRQAPSWLKSLGDGWVALTDGGTDASVSLVTNQLPSVSDRLPQPDASDDTQRTFAAFVSQVLNPIRSGALKLDQVPVEWAGAVKRMQEELEFDQGKLNDFLRVLHLEFATPDPLATRDSTRRGDILQLSDALYRRVSNANAVVVLNRQELLEEAGWTDRVRLRNNHQFPVDLDTYEPLDAPIAALTDILSTTTRGHIALVGPPGSGKSTLLAQSLMQTNDIVIRYYAYVPGPGGTRTRLENRGFLHDIVFLLEQATNNRGHLVERSLDELRDAFIALIDSAAKDYGTSGRKTVVVVDGLDHVERDYPGSASLLREIPRPNELPDGVVFILGTRTLSPLPPETRQDLESSARMVDLQDHRLTHDAVLAICRRLDSVAMFGENVHNAVATLAGGHPLSLAYLLNLVADAETADSAIGLITRLPQYAGDIAQQYRAIWDSLAGQPQELLATVARLRIPFEMTDLSEWYDPLTCRKFRDDLRFLFRRTSVSYNFFHDSFRQFVIALSNPSDLAEATDPLWDAVYHRRIADLCSRASRPVVRWEELYHRHRAGQNFLHLASQESFREQVAAMRGPVTVREDLAIVLNAAAADANTLLLVNAIFAKSEAESRWSVLEGVDVIGALVDAGLPDEAVAYAGIHQGRSVPLHQAYRLASRLGRRGSPDGRRVFDAAEPSLFDDAQFATFAGHENDVYEEWALAAPMYRPLPKILNVVAKLHPGRRDESDRFGYDRQVMRFAQVTDAVSDALSSLGRTVELASIDSLLATMLAEHPEDDDGRIPLIDSRLRVLELRLVAAAGTAEASDILAEGLAYAESSKLYIDTILDWAEHAIRFGRTMDADRLIVRCPLATALDRRDLGVSSDGAIGQRFRYWRMRHRLLRHHTPELGDSILPSVTRDKATQTGGEVDLGIPSDHDEYATQAAGIIDLLVRTLAAAAAATDEKASYTLGRLDAVMLQTIHATKRLRRRPHATSNFGMHRVEIMQLLTEVTLDHGLDSAARLCRHINFQVRSDVGNWPNSTLLTLGRQFQSAGVTPEWYQAAVGEAEAELTWYETDLHSRLEHAAALVPHLADLGRADDARVLARRLVELAFGVGYRKDHQFDHWMDWFERALAGGLPNAHIEAIDLAGILTAAAPMTEGAPRDAAARLPSIVATQHPGIAVALFESLIRSGTVNHLVALSLLLERLVSQVKARPVLHSAIVDMATDLVVRCSTVARPSLIGTVAAEVAAHLDSEAASALRTELSDRIGRDALPTTRSSWLAELDAPPSGAPSHGASDLDLSDGSSMSAAEVGVLVTDAASLVALRKRSARNSIFRWSSLVEGLTLSNEELSGLREEFDGTTHRRDADVLVVIGRKWLHLGSKTAALACATAALEIADENSWATGWGTARRDAHILAIESGGASERARAWLDVAKSAASETWRADILLNGLHPIVAMLDPGTAPTDIWLAIRAHLAGMVPSLHTGEEDPLAYQPLRWWLPVKGQSIPRVDCSSTAAQALAVLIIDHASHILWMVHDPAIAIAARYLGSDFPELETTVETILQADPPDDVIEALGRIVSSSPRTDYGAAAQRIDDELRTHASQYVRDLAASKTDEHMALPARYRLQLPPDGSLAFGASEIGLGPYEGVVRLCATAGGIDEDQLIEHALLIMDDYSTAVPVDALVVEALSSAGMNFMRPYRDLLSARAAAGRIVKDFRCAGYLSSLNPHDAEVLRSFDGGLVDVRPTWRPSTTPPPPPAGHDTTLDAWMTGISDRLDEYVTAINETDGLVIAACTQATVLNWTRAQEEFTCSVVLGNFPTGRRTSRPTVLRNKLKADLATPVIGRPPNWGDALAIENSATAFHQLDTFWMSFKPRIAAHFGWMPAPERPGTWVDERGRPMVELIEWVDGWPGHGDPSFDDTEESGVLVVATALGAATIRHLGALTRTSQLHRRGRGRDSGAEPAAELSERRVELLGEI